MRIWTFQDLRLTTKCFLFCIFLSSSPAPSLKMWLLAYHSHLAKSSASHDFLGVLASVSCALFEDTIIKYYSVLFSYQTLHQFLSSPHLDPSHSPQILSFVLSVSFTRAGKIIWKKILTRFPFCVEELQKGSLWHDMKSDSFWWHVCMRQPSHSDHVICEHISVAVFLHLTPPRRGTFLIQQ